MSFHGCCRMLHASNFVFNFVCILYFCCKMVLQMLSVSWSRQNTKHHWMNNANIPNMLHVSRLFNWLVDNCFTSSMLCYSVPNLNLGSIMRENAGCTQLQCVCCCWLSFDFASIVSENYYTCIYLYLPIYTLFGFLYSIQAMEIKILKLAFTLLIATFVRKISSSCTPTTLLHFTPQFCLYL